MHTADTKMLTQACIHLNVVSRSFQIVQQCQGSGLSMVMQLFVSLIFCILHPLDKKIYVGGLHGLYSILLDYTSLPQEQSITFGTAWFPIRGMARETSHSDTAC